MYIICAYDVEENRCTKVMKILRKYLFHVQKSVFEGTLTPNQYKDLTNELQKVSNAKDSILFYISYNEKQIYKKSLHGECEHLNIMI